MATLYQSFLTSAGVSTDTRSLEPGMIFFALKGENFNGNKFAGKALESAASLVVTDEDPGLKHDKIIRVENSLQALQQLAHHHRKQLKARIIGITGSNGKTTTKELIHRVLSTTYSCYATRGNLNNHIGVPLSLLELNKEEYAIIEMGANKKGDIAELCSIADPDEGIITNIGKAHLEGFGSMEGIRMTKTELYRHVDIKKGILFVNGRNRILTGSLDGDKSTPVFYFDGPGSLCTGEVLSESGPLEILIRFTEGGEYRVQTQIPGRYNLENLVAAACIGIFHGVPEDKIVSAIAGYHPYNQRSQLMDSGRNRILLDAYNANPTSMEGAIRAFFDMDADNKLLIIGDMLELGEYTESEHRKILELIQELDFQGAILVGPVFFSLKKEFPFTFFENIEKAAEHLKLKKVYNHLVLIKASRGLKLESLGDFL